MRKQDIKPGVVYAYQVSKDYGKPAPIMFLNAPADGKLFSSIGYPAVKARRGASPDVLKGYALADFTAATSRYIGDDAELEFVIVTVLGQVTGTYEDAKADYDARQEADRVQRQQDNERKAENERRAASVLAAFESAGVKASYWDHTVTLSLPDAEKLAALLSSVSVPETPEGTG